ncbi:MAG: DUF47 domain-containing protein [Acidimicrobiales bacterium]
MSGVSRRTRRPESWRGRFFLAVAPDVVGVLVEQGQVSLQALEAFERWSAGGGVDHAQAVRDFEHAADVARLEVVRALRSALATPIDQEDLYVLSERCDHVVNSVKNIVGEAEALTWAPDAHAASMGGHLRVGMAELVEGFAHLQRDTDKTGDAADRAVTAARAVEHAYRSAMQQLGNMDDLRAVFTARELYRSYARTADVLAGVADRLWYAVLSGT